MALRRVAIPSPNYSSRGGATVRLIVFHTAEGSTTYQSLGAYFQGNVEASSHVGIDDTPGEIGEYVAPGGKAWTAANANPYSVQAELCAFASWDLATWHAHPVMLESAAAWAREESDRFGIPLVALDDVEAQGGGRGVTQHENLGAAGGGHWDCGPAFPMAEVLAMAGGSVSPPSTAAPTPPPAGGQAPPWPGRYLTYPPEMQGEDVRTWQAQMDRRGWGIAVDGWYGGGSREVCSSFQLEKGLAADGVVGPDTWAASWNAPVT